MKSAIGIAAALGVLLVAGKASATKGIVFVHGTADEASGSAATSDYWTQSSINSMAGGNAYLVVGYQGSSCNAKGFDINGNACSSWSSIADQIAAWVSSAGITSIVLVTHSNGVNPIRYMLAHKTATAHVTTVMNLTRKVVAIAGDMTGTPLADKVWGGGSFDSTVGAAFGYKTAAVKEQMTGQMAADNSSSAGVFVSGQGSGSPGGIPMATVHGTGVSANPFSSNGTCGGYWLSVGLSLTKSVVSWPSCTDGFVGCDSATYQGTDVGNNGRTWNHNQSRRGCNGVAGYITGAINSAPNWNTAPPPDYGTGLTPQQEACNVTGRGWWGSGGSGPSGTRFFSYGCSSTMQTDRYVDFDCETSYGYETLYPSTTPNESIPADFAATEYSSSAISCPDSWLGDGWCDLCLIAKYGYDAGGVSGDSDCVNQGAGTANNCTDIAYDTLAYSGAWCDSGGCDVQTGYTQSH